MQGKVQTERVRDPGVRSHERPAKKYGRGPMGLLPSQMASLLLFFCPCLCFHYVLFFFICKPPNIKIIAFVFVLSQKDKSSSPKVGLLYVCWWQVWKVWVLSVSVRRVCRNHLYMVSCMRRCAHVCVYTLGIPACLSHSQPTV